MELKVWELKDIEKKIEREIEELLYKPILVSKYDTDKSEEQEMKKMRPIKKISVIGCLKKLLWGKIKR